MEREVVAYQWSTDEREGTIRVPAAILAVEDRWEVVAAGGGGGGSPATRFVDGYALALANMEVR